MRNSILKPILAGIFFGALAFFAPMFILMFFIIGGLFRLFAFRRMHYFMAHRMMFAQAMQNMNPEGYVTLSSKFNKGGQSTVKREIEVL